MFGIGAGELMVLMALALIIVGPQKLPEMGRTVGKAFADFKAYTDDMRSVLTLDQLGMAPTAPTAPTSHFPGTGGAQAYRGATEQVAASQPAVEGPVEPTGEASLAGEPMAVPIAVFVPEQPATPRKSYFSEEPSVEPVAPALAATETIHN